MSAQVLTISVETRKRLIEAAIEAKNGSYSPYSKFRVGAALLATDGTIIQGANVENASYGGTICAERTAIVKAVSTLPSDSSSSVSHPYRSFIALAVSTDVSQPLSPCGICRQVLREFCSLDMPVLLVPADYPQALPDNPNQREKKRYDVGVITEGGVKETTVGELLPASFGPEHLELPRS